MTDSAKLKILIADDHEILRDGLKSMIDRQEDMEIVGTVGTGRSAVRIARELRPDVVVMDIKMPDINGIDATRQILKNIKNTRVLCLSMHKEQSLIKSMFEAGASGYLVKDCAGRELINAIKSVREGKTYISPSIAGDVVQGYMRNMEEGAQDSVYSQLSPREREILQLIAEGYNTKEIADKMDISDKTVAAHRLSVMETLDLHSVADLTRYAIRHGLVEA